MYNNSNCLQLDKNFSSLDSIYESIPENFNLASYLLAKNTHLSEKIAFYSQSRNISYSELGDFTACFSAWVKSLNARYEERVLILLPDCLEFIVSFLGIIWGGNVSVLINEAIKIDDIAYMIENSRSRIIISNCEWRKKLKNYNLSFIEHWVDIDDGYWEKVASFKPVSVANTVKDEPAFWAYTSGSTGRPKGVIHAHYSPIVACVRYAKAVLNLTEKDVIYSAPSMAFSYGLGTSLYMPLFLGASAVIDSTASNFGFIEVINQYQPTVFFGIPNNYATISSLEEISPLLTKSLRLCVSAGEQLPPTLWQKWKQRYGISICEGIGTTESTHIFISNFPGNCVPGSSGKAVDGYKISLITKEGVLANPNEIGRLQVSSEGFMLGYWNRLKETQVVLSSKTLYTADLYKCDDEGNYYFIGREDNLLKVSGMWVSPLEIENEILKLDAISEVAVIVTASEKIQETTELVAFLVKAYSDDKQVLLTHIRKNLKTSFKKYHIPKRFYFIESLPRTGTGKIDRSALRKLSLTEKEELYESA